MNVLDIAHLVTFVEVVETGTFTRAAKTLAYSQSTVSGHINALERHFDTPLFVRKPDGVRLSPAGEILLPTARDMLRLERDVRQRLGNGSSGVDGRLLIGSMESLSTYRLVPLLEYMHRRHPQIHLTFRPGTTADAVEGVRNGQYDCAFILDETRGFEGLNSHILCEEEIVTVAAPSDPLADAHTLSARDIFRSRRVYTSERGCGYRDGIELRLRQDDVEPDFSEVGSVEAMKQSAIYGIGVAVMPRYAAEDEISHGDLAQLDWDCGLRMATQLVWRSEHKNSAALAAFKDAVTKSANEWQNSEPRQLS